MNCVCLLLLNLLHIHQNKIPSVKDSLKSERDSQTLCISMILKRPASHNSGHTRFDIAVTPMFVVLVPNLRLKVVHLWHSDVLRDQNLNICFDLGDWWIPRYYGKYALNDEQAIAQPTVVVVCDEV